MKKLNLGVFFGVSLLLASNAAFSAGVSFAGSSNHEFVKLNPEQLRQGLLAKCAQTEGCRADEINHYVDGVVSQIESSQSQQALLAGGGIEGTIPEIIRKIQESGFKVIEVTLQSGEKVVRFTAEQLGNLYDNPVVKGMVRAGEKSIELTLKGVEKTYDVTIDLSKKVGVYQVASVTVRTAYNIVTDVLGDVAKGTVDVLDAFFRSRPVILLVDGAEYLAKKVHLGEIAEKAGEYAWETTTIFFEGAWNVVEFSYKGTMVVLGLPVVLAKWVFGKH